MSSAALALAFLSTAQTDTGIIGARDLALSPDGSQLAFTYRGDVWVVSSKGGRAEAITTNIEMDERPVWSPDGQRVAFASNRNGNNDIYISDLRSGAVERLTWAPTGDVPSDWSPDGRFIVMRNSREKSEGGIYEIEVATGRLREVVLDMFGNERPKYRPGGSIVYERMGYPWSRPRYQGSGAAQIWATTREGQRRKIRSNGLQHLWLNPVGDSDVLCVTPEEVTPSSSPAYKSIGRVTDSVARTPNVHRIGSDGRAARVTNYISTSPRFLTATKDGKTMAYELDGRIMVGSTSGPGKPIVVTVPLDDKSVTEERLVLNAGVDDVAISPDNATLYFSARNEIWSVPTKKAKGPNADDATQVTQWPGLDAVPVVSPDGKWLFFVSDRDGTERLYKKALPDGAITPVSEVNSNVGGLKFTPDGTKLAFWQSGREGGLFVVPLVGGTPTRIVKRPGLADLRSDDQYDFSPDGRYVAYSDTLRDSGYYYWERASNIYVVDVRTGVARDVTQLSASHFAPHFTPDGKYLLFGSDRQGLGIYTLPLQKEASRAEELELKYEAPKTTPTVEIDFNEISQRIRKMEDGGFTDLTVDPKTGETIFLRNGVIHKMPYEDGPARPISGDGVESMRLNRDGDTLVLQRNDRLATLNLRQQNTPIVDVPFRAEWTRYVVEERKAAYVQLGRSFQRAFYDPNFHGRDFGMLRRRYEKFLPAVGHRNEMATLGNMLLGELESSHSEVGPAAGNPGSVSAAHPGFWIDYGYEGPGLKIARVVPGSPASFPGRELKVGEIVTKINGKPVDTTEKTIRDVLYGQVGRELTYTVKGLDGKERTVKTRAISGGEMNGLAWEQRLRDRRALVDKLSGGRVAYVHIAGMGGGELDRLNRELWQYASGRKAVIIDVRNNGGGNTSDRIIDILERQPNAIYAPRDEEPFRGPGQAIGNLPMVVMHAESSYSNAEMFPAAMKARNLATLVGMPTTGYVIYTYGLQLVDGTNARMPSTGVYRADGSNTENNGQKPDVQVDITPDQYLRGEDPQLEAAVKVLLAKIK